MAKTLKRKRRQKLTALQIRARISDGALPVAPAIWDASYHPHADQPAPLPKRAQSETQPPNFAEILATFGRGGMELMLLTMSNEFDLWIRTNGYEELAENADRLLDLSSLAEFNSHFRSKAEKGVFARRLLASGLPLALCQKFEVNPTLAVVTLKAIREFKNSLREARLALGSGEPEHLAYFSFRLGLVLNEIAAVARQPKGRKKESPVKEWAWQAIMSLYSEKPDRPKPKVAAVFGRIIAKPPHQDVKADPGAAGEALTLTWDERIHGGDGEMSLANFKNRMTEWGLLRVWPPVR